MEVDIITDSSNKKYGFQVDDNFEEAEADDTLLANNNFTFDDKNPNKSTLIKPSNVSTGPVLKEYRKIMVPANKLKTLKENWPTIVKAVIDHMKLEVRMNVKAKCIELRTSDETKNTSAMQKSEDFLKAFMCGFDLSDAISLLRLDDLYYETFDIKDVKALKGDHLSRCIGRICGEKGKTKHAIENTTRTRIIVEGHKISLLGAHVNVGMARNTVCSLILGAQPGKVYAQLRAMGRKLNELA